MFIDLHSHLDICDNPEQAVQNAVKAGLKIAVVSGIHHESIKKCLEYAENNNIIKASIGLYPVDALRTELGNYEADIDSELKFIEENLDKTVAIGEIGLDYKTGSDKEAQQTLFRRQLDLAKKHNKPVIIHSRKAELDVLDIVDEYDLKVILHCFSAKKKLVQRAREAGYFFTIPTCVVRSEHFQQIAKDTPINQLFCETDAPYLSPFPDKRNEPAFVVEAYKKIAEIKELDITEVANLIYNNWQRTFE